MLIFVGWVPPYLCPSGACLGLDARVCRSLVTLTRVAPSPGPRLRRESVSLMFRGWAALHGHGLNAGDGPHEGRELTRDGGGHGVGVLAAREQSPVAPIEADLGAPGDVADGFGELLLPGLDLLGDLGPVAIGLGRLNQDSARVAVAALGDSAEPAPVTPRVLARGEDEVAHELARVVEAIEDATLAKLITARARHRLAVRSAGWLALAVEGAVTLLAAFLVHERRVAALRTDLTDGRGRIEFLRVVAAVDQPELLGLFGREELAERPCNGVGDRADPVGAEADVGRASDARELLDDLRQPGLPIRETRVAEEVGHEPAERFGEGFDVGAGLAHAYEDLEGLARCRDVQRHVDFTERTLDLPRLAPDAPRAWLDERDEPRLGWRRRLGRGRARAARANVEDLLALAPGAEDRNAEAAGVPGEPGSARDGFDRRGVRGGGTLRG